MRMGDRIKMLVLDALKGSRVAIELKWGSSLCGEAKFPLPLIMFVYFGTCCACVEVVSTV